MLMMRAVVDPLVPFPFIPHSACSFYTLEREEEDWILKSK